MPAGVAVVMQSPTGLVDTARPVDLIGIAAELLGPELFLQPAPGLLDPSGLDCRTGCSSSFRTAHDRNACRAGGRDRAFRGRRSSAISYSRVVECTCADLHHLRRPRTRHERSEPTALRVHAARLRRRLPTLPRRLKPTRLPSRSSSSPSKLRRPYWSGIEPHPQITTGTTQARSHRPRAGRPSPSQPCSGGASYRRDRRRTRTPHPA